MPLFVCEREALDNRIPDIGELVTEHSGPTMFSRSPVDYFIFSSDDETIETRHVLHDESSLGEVDTYRFIDVTRVEARLENQTASQLTHSKL